MLKKTITYTDFDGNERTEDFYFNLTKAELTMLTLSHAGGLEKHLDKIIKAKDQPSIMKNFREIIKLSYGEKSDDGRRFVKSEEIYQNFEQTEAYSILFMELCTDSKAAGEFVNAILPKDLVDEVEKNKKVTELPKADK